MADKEIKNVEMIEESESFPGIENYPEIEKYPENEVTEARKKNVYQKLIEARYRFLNSGIKKSGIHMKLEFKYFELSDIIPTATAIFRELGLISITSFEEKTATMEIINCDNPNERITFASPMADVNVIVSNTGKQVTNEIQTLGAMETYQRRYLYLIAMDIVENDVIDATTGSNSSDKKEVKKVPNVEDKKKPSAAPVAIIKPITKEERENVKEQVVAENEKADELQIKALKKALKKLIEVDPSQTEFVQKIALKTSSFTTVTKKVAEQLILKIGEMIEELSGGAE